MLKPSPQLKRIRGIQLCAPSQAWSPTDSLTNTISLTDGSVHYLTPLLSHSFTSLLTFSLFLLLSLPLSLSLSLPLSLFITHFARRLSSVALA